MIAQKMLNKQLVRFMAWFDGMPKATSSGCGFPSPVKKYKSLNSRQMLGEKLVSGAEI